MTQPASKLLPRLRRIQSIPLRTVLVVPFVLEVMLAVGLTAYMVYRNGQEAVDDLANQLVAKISDRVEDRLDDYLQTPVGLTRSNANIIQSGILNWQNPAVLKQYFSQQLSDLDSAGNKINSIFLADKNQNFFLVKKQDEKDQFFDTKTTALNLASRYLPPENSGVHLLSPSVELSPKFPKQLSESPTNQQSEGEWQLFIDESALSGPTLKATYLQPFYDQNKTLGGVIGAAIDLSQVSKFLENLHVSQTGQVFIIERDGSLIATSTGESPLRPINQRQSRSQDVSTTPTTSTPTLQQFKAIRSLNSMTQVTAEELADSPDGLQRILEKQSFNFESKNQRYFVQVTPIQNSQNLDWLTVVVIPEADFAARIQRNQYTMLVMCGAALMGAIGLGIFTAQQIAEPILRLSRASRDFMLGKLDEPLQEKSHITEIAILAHAFNEMTEHLQASFDEVRQALQESEEKFTTVFRMSPDPMLVTTLPDGVFLEVNDSFLRLFELSREETVNRPATELGLWPTLEDRKQFLQVIEQTGHVHSYEANALTKTGKKRIVLVSSERIELDGQTCLLTVSKDITERKRLEEALRESEAKLQSVLNSATAAICRFWLYPDGNIEYDYFSPSHDEVFGLDSKKLMGNSPLWRSRLHPDDKTKALGIHPPAFQDGCLTTEYRFYHSDGSLRWISDFLTFQWEPAQKRWNVTAIAFDITERKQLELALQESQARLSDIVNSAAVAICCFQIDADCNIRYNYMSAGQVTIFGYTPEEFLAHPSLWRSRIHPDDWRNVIQPSFADIFAERAVALEYRFFHRDGSLRWVATHLKPRLDASMNCWVVTTVATDITARKQTEQALQQSESRYRSVVNSIKEVLFQTDANGKWTFLNPAWTEIMGFTISESLGTSFLSYIHPDDHKQTFDYFQQLINYHYENCHHEIRCLTKKGEIRWVEIFARLTLSADGTVLGVSGTFNDITDRKHVEEALRISEAQFRSAFDTAAIGMNITALDGQFLRVNPRLCQMLGYTETELLRLSYQAITHPDDRAADAIIHQQLIAGHHPYHHFEKRIVHKEGQTIWVMANVSLVRDDSQHPLFMVSQMQDITARKQVEEALRHSEARFRAAFDTAMIGMSIFDLTGQFIDVNASLCKMYGYSETELLHMKLQDVTHPDDLKTDLHYLSRAIAGELDFYLVEKRNICKDGQIVRVLLSTSIVRDLEHHPLYFISQVEDIGTSLI